MSDGLTVPFGHRVVPGAGRKHKAVAPFPLLWTGKKQNQIKVVLKMRKCVHLRNWSPRFRRAGSQCVNLVTLWAHPETGAPSQFHLQNVPSPKAGVPLLSRWLTTAAGQPASCSHPVGSLVCVDLKIRDIFPKGLPSNISVSCLVPEPATTRADGMRSCLLIVWGWMSGLWTEDPSAPYILQINNSYSSLVGRLMPPPKTFMPSTPEPVNMLLYMATGALHISFS